jgi:hypothetical protein
MPYSVSGRNEEARLRLGYRLEALGFEERIAHAIAKRMPGWLAKEAAEQAAELVAARTVDLEVERTRETH